MGLARESDGMIAKIGLWLLIKAAEWIASGFLTEVKGEARRKQLVEFLIRRAEKAKRTKTTADDQLLRYWAGLLKSDRLKKTLEFDEL